jgi:putative glutamine amidotransferase
LVVNSQHHQSIKDIGENLRVTSTTVDGIVESIESTNDKFILGVQFHPESMIYNDKEFIKIFNYFIDRCK